MKRLAAKVNESNRLKSDGGYDDAEEEVIENEYLGKREAVFTM